MTDINEWPEPEQEERFDWSMPMKDIEKKYGNKKAMAIAEIPETNEPAPAITGDKDKAIVKFKKKYPHVFSMLVSTNPDLPRWIFDNLVK